VNDPLNMFTQVELDAARAEKDLETARADLARTKVALQEAKAREARALLTRDETRLLAKAARDEAIRKRKAR
jgi:hypothetical protein